MALDKKINTNLDSGKTVQTIHIKVGECAVTSKKDIVLDAVLGSCVAVCVSDPFITTGGMNHFMLPQNPGQTGAVVRACYYGGDSIQCLCDNMEDAGAVLARCEFRLYGGAHVLNIGTDIGEKNIAVALEFMQKYHLKLVDFDLGGTVARKVRFFPHDNIVSCNYLPEVQPLGSPGV